MISISDTALENVVHGAEGSRIDLSDQVAVVTGGGPAPQQESNI